MTQQILYKYEREDGGVSVSPQKPECECAKMIRLIADVGKMLTFDGENLTPIVDVESVEGWREVDKPKESEDEENE